MHSALFLDLGGTLLRIEDDEIYLSPKGDIEILPNVTETLNRVTEDLIFVVTNQSAIEKGLLSNDLVKSWIDEVFSGSEKTCADFWACPIIGSTFRKPSPSMILALADKHFVDLSRSTYVGDSNSDSQCAAAAHVGRFIWAADYFNWSE